MCSGSCRIPASARVVLGDSPNSAPRHRQRGESRVDRSQHRKHVIETVLNFDTEKIVVMCHPVAQLPDALQLAAHLDPPGI